MQTVLPWVTHIVAVYLNSKRFCTTVDWKTWLQYVLWTDAQYFWALCIFSLTVYLQICGQQMH